MSGLHSEDGKLCCAAVIRMVENFPQLTLPLHSRMLAIIRNHFPEHDAFSHPNKLLQEGDSVSPDGVVRLKRSEILYGLLTRDEQKLAAKELANHLSAVCDCFLAARGIRRAAQDFHEAVGSNSKDGMAVFI